MSWHSISLKNLNIDVSRSTQILAGINLVYKFIKAVLHVDKFIS